MAIDNGYSKPDVIVREVITQQPIVLTKTSQRPCIIGTCGNVVRNGDSGSYDGVAASYPYPDPKTGQVVDLSSVKVSLVKNGVSYELEDTEYTPSGADVSIGNDITRTEEILETVSITGSISNGVLYDPNGKFISLNVKAADIVYSSTLPTGTVDIDSVVDETHLNVHRDTVFTGSVDIAGINVTGAAGDFANVSAGDELIIPSTSEKIIIQEVTDDSHLVLKNSVQVDATYTVSIMSNANDLAAMMYSVYSINHLGEEPGSSILISYAARRTDVSEVKLYEDMADFYLDYGTDVTSGNPIGMAADLMYKSGAVEFYVVPLQDDSYSSYINAIDSIDSLDVHYLVPLTLDGPVLDYYKAHVVEASLPDNKRERMLIACTDIVFRDIKTKSTTCTITQIGTTNEYTVDAPEAHFTSGNVVVGDLLYLEDINEKSDPSENYRVIKSVSGETTVVVESADDISSHTGIVVAAETDYTKREIAEYVRNVSDSIEEMLVVRMWPPRVEIETPYGDEFVDGYMLCAALSGLASALPSQAPLTNHALPGFKSLSYSNRYFKESDLNVMASGGVMIVTQKGDGGDPKIRQQLTTDMSSVKSREFSFIKNLNYLKKDYRGAMESYVGRYNITKELFDLMMLSSGSVFRYWRDDAGSYGPKVLSVDLISIDKDPNREDGIISEIEADLPLPNNKTTVTMYV